MSHFKKIPEVNFDAEVVHGDYHPIKDWEMDPKGYVLIRIDKEKKIIELGFCKTMNIIEIVFRGKKPQDVYFEVCKRDLLSRPDHYAYIGKELEKAYTALRLGIEYVQDEELNLVK